MAAGRTAAEETRRIGWRTWAAIAGTLVPWAAAFAAIRAAMRHYPGAAAYSPGEVALLRFLVAGGVLAAYALAVRARMPSRSDLGRIALAGFLGISVYHVALNYGEVTVQAGAASLLIATGPVFTALLAVAFLEERLTPLAWGGVALAFSGAALISLGGGGGLVLDPGALLVLVAAVATAAYFVVAKEPLRRYSAVEFTTYAVVAGVAPMLVFLPGLLRALPRAAPQATAAIVFLGVFPGAVSYLLWSYALARMPASRLASFLYTQPLVAGLIAWGWLGEVPALATVAGGALSLAGVALVNFASRRR